MIDAIVGFLLDILLHGIYLTVFITVVLCLVLRLLGGLRTRERPENDLWFMGQQGWWEP